ncbi:hypothetical protein JMJ35_007339 [Cladonia borealis]|uniref:HAD-superfamily hydrolase n=1 Tax=Cladonia borealis TaxID=184061 RepID=A0AA39QXM3_9LECA|nr:hypothetical protein JMJ35_007339 [Cladonia borealis]
MATLIWGTRPRSLAAAVGQVPKLLQASVPRQWQHNLQTSAQVLPKVSDFAFAFDIDGVLLRSSNPLPRARKALSYLQEQRIPFILLTNGGGKSEKERVQEISDHLEVPLDVSMFVQAHTPFAELVGEYKDKCILVVGGEGDKCRKVAENYGFANVLTPADLITAFPNLWPFGSFQNYKPYARALSNSTLSPRSYTPNLTPPPLKIDAIFIFHDPRDWALDTQLLLDLLLSSSGHLGSLSPKNGNPSLPNNGYQQDSQPPLYFSNPDLLWAAAYHLPRLGQGGFREAFEGVWKAVTGNAKLEKKMFGKPHQETFAFAEKRLARHRHALLGAGRSRIGTEGLKRVYMVGDNPESDIQGANEFKSPAGSQWRSILVRSGVFDEGKEPVHRPDVVVGDVWDAVEWGLEREGWK